MSFRSITRRQGFYSCFATRNFTADITYGMLASGSCLLTDVVDQLHEGSKKVNSVERLSRRLNKGTPKGALLPYLHTIRKWVPDEPVVHVDDSDVVKPDVCKFEALGLVRDGSKSSYSQNVYEKGYCVTEACSLTKSNHPASFYSRIHSSQEKSFTSVNMVTFEAMERAAWPSFPSFPRNRKPMPSRFQSFRQQPR